jgi:hypothetical protein
MAEEAMQVKENDDGAEVEIPEVETEETESEVKIEETEKETEKEPVEAKSEQEDEIEDYSEGVKKRINKLTYKVRESERREQAAIEYAKSVQEELNKTKNKLSKSDQNLYSEYSTRVTSELNSAQERYKKAYESGDTDALLEAQKDLAKLAVEEESLKRVKPQETETEVIQDEQEAKPKWEKQPEQEAPAPDPKAQAWAKKNEWFGDDLAMTTAAFAFHRQLTEGEGYDPTSDEYYAEVDKRLAEAFPHKLGKTQKEVKETVAGSSKGVGTTKARSRRTIKLTPSQVAIAKRLGVPLEEYAKHIKE